MEIISFPYHMSAVCGLVILAAHRRNLFPFVLVSMYAAFFYLIHLSEQLSLISQLVLSSTLAAVLLEIAITSKRRKYIKRFCAVMLLSILNQSLIFFFSFVDAGATYIAAQSTTAICTALISAAEIYILIRIVYGAGRGEPIYTKLGLYIVDSISIFKPNQKAIHSSIWKKRETHEYRTSEQR